MTENFHPAKQKMFWVLIFKLLYPFEYNEPLVFGRNAVEENKERRGGSLPKKRGVVIFKILCFLT